MSYHYLNTDTKELIAKKIRYYINTRIDKKAFPNTNDVSVSAFYDTVTQSWYTALRMMFLGNRVNTQIDGWIYYPTTLWQHLKMSVKRRLPDSLSKHISVKFYKKPQITTIHHMCPHIEFIDGEMDENMKPHIDFLRGDKQDVSGTS